jgi:arylformamidase
MTMFLRRVLGALLLACFLSAAYGVTQPMLRNVAYGADEDQRFDVYAPLGAQGAPVIFLVHGGGWAIGDKAAARVVENKVAYWLPRGFAIVAVNYRMLPKIDPVEQARDVARALAAAQKQAPRWGGDPHKFIPMGHSAGAHLIALLAAAPGLAAEAGAQLWVGAVLLDSGALDVPEIMNGRHFGLYDHAFGSDPAYWQASSPFHQLSRGGPPLLLVCSTRRFISCPQAERFLAKARSFGTRAELLRLDLSHGEINSQLGAAPDYTAAVDARLQAWLSQPSR